jgi:EAL and modified HD-GYP domain-containing signal transduction protein
MCEILCVMAGYSGSDSYFMTGFLSLVDVFLGAPLDDCLRELPLNDEMCSALSQQQGPMGAALGCVLGYERGNWEKVTFDRLAETEIATAYALAVDWADSAHAALFNA